MDNNENRADSAEEKELVSAENSGDAMVIENKPIKEDKLGTEKVGKLLFKLAIPAIVAQIINMLYNIVDRIYVARLGVDAALSGLTVCFPILMIISAFAALLGQGGAPLASIKLGQKKNADAEKIMGNAFALLLLISVVLTVVLQIVKVPVLNAFGATSESIEYANSYLFVYLLGTVFVQVALGLNSYISAQGYSKTSMLTILIGAVLNIILDPIFIFGLNMGVMGAAIATVIAQGVSALWVFVFLISKKSNIRIKLKNMIPSRKVIFSILALGVSPFIMQATESLVQLTFNMGLKMYSATETIATANIAAMGVIFTVMQMFTMPMSGLGQGAQPIISFNYGAGKMDRVKKTFKLLFFWSIGISAAAFVLVEVFPAFFAIAISPSDTVLNIAVRGLRVFMAGAWALGFQFSCQNTLVALGQAKVSLFLALLRKVILLVPLALILPLFLTNKVFALQLAEPLADVVAATVTTIMFFVLTKKLFKGFGSNEENKVAKQTN